MPSAADDVAVAIRESGGSIPFDRFMDIALYGPHGFYTSETPGRAGRRGDFLTSPEVGPLFGEVIARALDDAWQRLGEPDGFTVVDAGAGPGTLARSVLAGAPRCLERGRYVAVEVSDSQRGLHPDGVESTATMPTDVEVGVILANELLDNVPFQMWVHDERWRPARVALDGLRFVEVLGGEPPPGVLPSDARLGARAPVQTGAAEWLEGALHSLGRGAVWVLDYVSATTAEVSRMPWREWLRTYRGHERGGHWFTAVGEQDITTQVCLDQLAAVREPDAVRTQAQFLRLWGIEEMVEEGKKVWRENAAAPGLSALRMRSRVSESEALLDPAGLGGFLVVEWRV